MEEFFEVFDLAFGYWAPSHMTEMTIGEYRPEYWG
jgi:hypothetical protein